MKTKYRQFFLSHSCTAATLCQQCSHTVLLETTLLGALFFWQRNRDSNPNKQSQSLLCYRYTIPLGRELLYTNNSHLSSVFLIFFYLFLYFIYKSFSTMVLLYSRNSSDRLKLSGRGFLRLITISAVISPGLPVII